MIFKTFDNDIDKWTAKIGIFGKSFNELGTEIKNALWTSKNEVNNFGEEISFWDALKNNLLPKKEDTPDDYEEDFKSELIKKLVDYKKYKEVCETFKVLEENRSNFYTKTPSDISLYSEKSLNNDNVTVDDLIDAFKKFMERREFEKPLNTKITTKELSVSDRVVEIRNILRNKKSVNFMELFTRRDKSYVVVTFLSILEMAKDLEISIEQDNNFNDIIIKSCK